MKIVLTEKYLTLTSNTKEIVNAKNVTSLIIKKKTKTKILHS